MTITATLYRRAARVYAAWLYLKMWLLFAAATKKNRAFHVWYAFFGPWVIIIAILSLLTLIV